MQVSTALQILTALCAGATAYLVYRQTTALSAEQKSLLINNPDNVTMFALALLPTPIALLSGRFDVALLGAIYFSGSICVFSFVQRKKLRKLGFSEDFISRRKKSIIFLLRLLSSEYRLYWLATFLRLAAKIFHNGNYHPTAALNSASR